MGWIIRFTLAVCVTIAAIAASFAAGLPTPSSTHAASSPSLDAIAGKKLISIDGSTVTLTTAEGTLTRETIGANGAIRRTNFHFLTEQLGTVSDLPNPNKAVGVFRMGKRDVTIQYADGGFEEMFVNDEGGLLVETKGPQNAALCTAWYPEGHVFSMEDRKEALSQYASRLGIAENSEKIGPARSTGPACVAPGDPATKAADVEKTSLASGTMKGSALALGLGLPLAASPSASEAPPTFAVAQAAHTIDEAAQAALQAGAPGTRASVPTLPQTAGRASGEQFTQSRQPRGGFASAPEGASKCLSVESERGYRGFRNYCAFPVQFAYCVVGRTLESASCQYGAVQGSTEPWGFTAIGDRPLTIATMPIEMRWIACRGRSGDVLPRLEQIDPPSGHCVAVR